METTQRTSGDIIINLKLPGFFVYNLVKPLMILFLIIPTTVVDIHVSPISLGHNIHNRTLLASQF